MTFIKCQKEKKMKDYTTEEIKSLFIVKDDMQKKIEAIEIHKKELNRLLDCYLETHERPSETTIRNVYTVRDLFVEKWNEERNINNQ